MTLTQWLFSALISVAVATTIIGTVRYAWYWQQRRLHDRRNHNHAAQMRRRARRKSEQKSDKPETVTDSSVVDRKD